MTGTGFVLCWHQQTVSSLAGALLLRSGSALCLISLVRAQRAQVRTPLMWRTKRGRLIASLADTLRKRCGRGQAFSGRRTFPCGVQRPSLIAETCHLCHVAATLWCARLVVKYRGVPQLPVPQGARGGRERLTTFIINAKKMSLCVQFYSNLFCSLLFCSVLFCSVLL